MHIALFSVGYVGLPIGVTFEDHSYCTMNVNKHIVPDV